MRAVYGAAVWKIIPRDVVGASPGTHDFDLSDGTATVAVEVSTIAETETLRDSAAWNRHFPDLAPKLEGIKSGWLVTVSGEGNARDISLQLRIWLADLERLDMASARTGRWQEHAFDPEAHRPPWFETLRAMQAAGVISAEVAPALPAGQCSLLKVDNGYTWNTSDHEYLSMFVSAQLEGVHASDVQKLARATADCRLLFLWLDAQSHFDVTRRLDNHLIGGRVRNAGPVDEVWIGRHLIDETVTVYRWREANGWVSHDLLKTDLVDT